MATGGIFALITNDGKQDRMLMATELLSKRLEEINVTRQMQNGGPASALQNLPTLLDIEKTHVLFTNAHFKPFVAIGFEYNKVRPTSGNPSLGQTIQFSIPMFGDFFHDICCHVVLNQPTLNSTAASLSDAPLMRWCNFPGERLLKKVTQEVGGNPLDEYTSLATNMHREFRIAPNKQESWKRCIGQESSEQGFVAQPNWLNSGVDPQNIVHRLSSRVHTGNQTPTGQKQGQLELFIPLLFWYNKDVRLAVPSVAIPFGQRFINIELASLSELVDVVPRGSGTWAAPNGSITESTPTLRSIELYINNIFVNPEIHKIYIKRVGFSLIRVHRQQIYNANSSSMEVHLQQMKWPIEFMFIGMKIKDYWASASASVARQHLDKWHSFNQIVDTPYSTQGQNVHRQARLVDDTATVSISTGGAVTLGGTGGWLEAVAVGDVLKVNGQSYVALGTAAAGATTGFTVNPAPAVAVAAATSANSARVLSQGLTVNSRTVAPTLDTLGVKAHGVTIYDTLPAKFFSAYTVYSFGDSNINTPEDTGILFLPFSLYPGSYQPSGHINLSRAREFYVSYESSVIGSGTEGSLYVLASAINFLLISDGAAVLRYST